MALTLDIAREPTGAQPDHLWTVEATRWVGPGITFMPTSEYRVVGQGAEDEDIHGVGPAYEAIFGDPPLGSKIFVRARWVSTLTGLASSWVYSSAIVAAP